MDLTAEEKALGKENFNQVIGTTRRDFLLGTLATGVTTGAGLGSMYYGYGAKLEDPLRIGIIGTGDEGNVLIGGLNPDFVEVVAIADIRPYNIYRAFHGDFYSDNAKKARPGLYDVYKEKHGWKNVQDAMDQIDVYQDKYEELLERDDIEAVIIALPLWLHEIAAIKAMQAGKHVLTEKLMAQTIGQCKAMSRVSEETGMILATGHQRHYSILYANAVDTIRRGLIGDIHHIRAQWHRSNMPGKDSWQPPMPEAKDFSQRDYDLAINAAKPKGRAAIQEVAAQHPLRAKLRSWKGKLKNARSPKDIALWTARVAQVEAQLLDHSVDAEKYGYKKKNARQRAGHRDLGS